MTQCHPNRIASPRFARWRGINKDGYALEWHLKVFQSQRPKYEFATRTVGILNSA